MASVDVAHAVVTDNAGNIYITGESDSSLSVIDIVTVKYGPAGNLVWVRRFTGLESNVEVPSAIAVDSSGNVFVTGMIYENDSYFDVLTIKYDPNGVEQWARRYNGPDNDWDLATSIAVDNAGNAYVGGGSFGLSSGYDFLTIKYAPDGTESWIRRYDGIDGLDDGINALTLDDSGNVYATGVNYTFSNDGDVLTIKYDSGGVKLWEASFTGTGGLPDEAYDITLAPDRSVVVTGYSTISLFVKQDITILYDPQGMEQWSARHASGNQQLISVGVHIDGSGGIYVGAWGMDDSYTIKYSSTGLEQWAQREDNLLLFDLTLDPSGSPVVTGSVGPDTLTAADIRTVKYGPDGSKLWTRTYDRDSLNDIAIGVAIDHSGNIIVFGATESVNTSQDYGVIKYAPTGTMQWVQAYNGYGRSSDEIRSIGVDDLGNVYLGISSGIQNDTALQSYETVATVLLKYSSSSDLVWVRTYPQARLRGIVVDGPGNVYVAGTVGDFTTSVLPAARLVTLKYNTSGTLEWVRTFSSPIETYQARAIALDSSSNVYIGAAARNDLTRDGFLVVKYSSDGSLYWAKEHSEYSDGTVEYPTAIAARENGVVALTGYDPSGSITILYEPDGTLRWARRAGTQPLAIAMDPGEGVYIAGGDGQLKYTPAGDVAWADYSGTLTFDVAVDDDGNCYVPSSSGLRKYGPSGNLEWNVSPPGFGAREVAVDGCGLIYTAGTGVDDSVEIAKFDPAGNVIWEIKPAQPLSGRSYLPFLEVDRQARVRVGEQTLAGLGVGFGISFLLTLQQLGTVALSSNSLAIGATPLQCSRTDTVSLFTSVCLPPDVISTTWDDTVFGVFPLDAIGSGSLEHRYLVRFTPSNPGVYRDTVFFTESTSNQTVALVVEGTGTDSFVAYASSNLLYDSVEVGCSDGRSLLVSNLTCRELSLTLTSSTYDYFAQPECLLLPPGDSATVLIRFAPLSIGDRPARLVITNSNIPKPDSITLVGYGLGTGTEVAITNSFGIGWQLISTPVESDCPVVHGRSYEYSSGYNSRDTLELGRGYWNKLTTPVVSFAGEPVSSLEHPLNAGWNIVGSISEAISAESLSTTPPGILITPFYAYSSAGYLNADSIKPGHGYWVKSSQSGMLQFQPGLVPLSMESRTNRVPMCSLWITDHAGNTRMLFLDDSPEIQQPGQYELPPLPPEGAFDVRFASGRRLEPVDRTTARDLHIQVSSAHYPVLIRWESRAQIPLHLSVGGLDVEMGETGSVQVSMEETPIALMVRSSESAPTAFSLDQNYPNPFNPSTTIRFGLPVNGHVRLEVFTTLGERVASLVDRVEEAGYHTVEFNGSEYPSGLYIYRLQSGPFTESRKLLLLK